MKFRKRLIVRDIVQPVEKWMKESRNRYKKYAQCGPRNILSN